MEYRAIAPEKAYTIFNGGGILLVCTRSPESRYNLAPIAWTCPLDYEPVTQLLFVCDPSHATFHNIEATGTFIAALPTFRQKELVLKTGEVSGKNIDKFERFGIPSRRGEVVDALVPEGVAGWAECEVSQIYRPGEVAIVCGTVKAAFAVPEAWKLVLHHVERDLFYRPGESV
ncbi:flavin reductase domain protein FMN-binding protein [Spirochaeta thermophila DSM 6578]|uniref:Flavin reductase domain protein FMN-binding protein n=1 Tax=Winmispira thermophila (strain ATCC 700085 / DSM 6578 / Z-1203) TaxID=869211 RepID=G0GET3_WINT7|nr:flavin reductase family protein [Spirochaeta thermophila]AEJ61489.1 flavin reductase domain protein FMN-binding protein [Spirochaeta thermophila DSM 6578]